MQGRAHTQGETRVRTQEEMGGGLWGEAHPSRKSPGIVCKPAQAGDRLGTDCVLKPPAGTSRASDILIWDFYPEAVNFCVETTRSVGVLSPTEEKKLFVFRLGFRTRGTAFSTQGHLGDPKVRKIQRASGV